MILTTSEATSSFIINDIDWNQIDSEIRDLIQAMNMSAPSLRTHYCCAGHFIRSWHIFLFFKKPYVAFSCDIALAEEINHRLFLSKSAGMFNFDWVLEASFSWAPYEYGGTSPHMRPQKLCFNLHIKSINTHFWDAFALYSKAKKLRKKLNQDFRQLQNLFFNLQKES